jgi:hypothetical protein
MRVLDKILLGFDEGPSSDKEERVSDSGNDHDDNEASFS